MSIKSILVFCGSNPGNSPVFQELAYQTGQFIARNGYRLIYGGGNVGLMGILASAALENGGEVTGIIPYFLSRIEAAHEGLTETIFVDTMLERKQKMAQLSDAVITLPGAYGTFDELFEELTARQLDTHHRPIGLLNAYQFYDPLIAMLDRMVEFGFLRPENRKLLQVAPNLEGLMDLLLKEAESWLVKERMKTLTSEEKR
jgi:uncharacterized protein (TIGR00730 family)